MAFISCCVTFLSVSLGKCKWYTQRRLTDGAMDFPGIARESCAGPSEKCKDLECCEPEKYRCLCDVGDDDSCTCEG
uniref:U62-Sparatoxin-Hju1a_1 n=1 Tax=Heteropoda jugulans TaxID=1358901 RepID=A0A4Q8K5C9_9ARAC